MNGGIWPADSSSLENGDIWPADPSSSSSSSSSEPFRRDDFGMVASEPRRRRKKIKNGVVSPRALQELVEFAFDELFPARPDALPFSFPNARTKESILMAMESSSSRVEGGEDVSPCFLWNKKEKDGRLKIYGRTSSCARFLYERCVGPLAKKDRLFQACPRDRLCMQTAHLGVRKKASARAPAGWRRKYYDAKNAKRRKTKTKKGVS